MHTEQDCLFCKMVRGEIPVDKVFEDESFICIRDLYPQAKKHFLLIPKNHIRSLAAAFPDQKVSQSPSEISALFETATRIARQEGLLPNGFRTVMNVEKDGGQTVFHIHLHILGGSPLKGAFA